jgi:hypothetical protein
MEVNYGAKSGAERFAQSFYLLVYALLGLFVFGALAGLLVYLLYGKVGLLAVAGGSFSNLAALKIMLSAQQLGLFLFPAVVLAFREKKTLDSFYGTGLPEIKLAFLTVMLSFAFLPLINLSYAWNQQLVFPDFLKSLALWMRAKEDAAAETTKAILKMKGISDLGINLLVIAAIPAVCEEFLFRGAIQRVLFKVKNNRHYAIWAAAIIFSTIHFQFFGFLPRLLLGAAFGYLYYWTGSIWYAVLAHFLNNAFAVFQAYYIQAHSTLSSNTTNDNLSWYVYVICAIITLLLFVEVKRLSDTKLKKQAVSIDEN